MSDDIKLPPLRAELIDILGRPNFMCGDLATMLRAKGQHIPHRSENEQAAVIYWLLGLYLNNPQGWRTDAAQVVGEYVKAQRSNGKS